MTRLSVIMSVKNGSDFLSEAVDSVLLQLRRDDEFLIRDDGSTDATSEILRAYTDQRLKLFSGDTQGLAKSLNDLIEYCRGCYVARMDADDISLPGRFDQQIEELERDGLDLISSARCMIDAEGIPIEEGTSQYGPEELRRFNGFTHGSWLFRRELIDQGFRYNGQWDTAQDYELLLRLFGAGKKLRVSDEITFKRRHHDAAISVSRQLEQRRAMLLAQQTYWETCGGTPQADAELAIVRWRLGNRSGALLPLVRCLFDGDIGYALQEIRYYRGNPDSIR